MSKDLLRAEQGLLKPARALFRGRFTGQIIRAGEIIDEFESPNIVVNQGLTNILDVYFRAQSGPGAWYVGIFQGNYTPVPTVAAATIASAATECVDYDEATRPVWTPGAVAANAVSNASSRAQFTFNAGRTVYGAFLINSSTKNGTAGVLAAAASFGSPRTVVSGDELLLTYSFAADT